MKYHNVLYNFLLFVGFCAAMGIFLVFKYKGKLTPEEMEERELEKKRYILSKIQNYEDAKVRTQQQLITGLPQWSRKFV